MADRSSKVIGGFLELELPEGHGGFFEFWRVPDDPHCLFYLGRSAFAALVRAFSPARVWVPAYMCKSIPKQVPAGALAFYSVGERLAPDVDQFADAVKPGDMVLGMNYFGRAPTRDFLSWLESRPDVVTVEDCAQTIDTGQPAWGDYRIFSPRKVLGVPDGGIIVPKEGTLPPGLRPSRALDMGSVGPLVLRFEDEPGTMWQAWHEEYESWQRALSASDRAMSRLSRALLGLADPVEVSRRRAENFAVLRAHLEDISLFAQIDAPLAQDTFVPFGFPVRLPKERRDELRARLWADRIYTFRHFADLVCPPEEFPREHALSAELLTLPCDQRYGPDDMERIVNVARGRTKMTSYR
jgi:dTDP-4-amino-4,6-dideoxygalactose transaminase